MLRVLGPVEVVGPDGVVPLGGAKERCLLAVLAVNAGAVVAEDRLVDALWDGSPPRTATKTLQNYVLRLRRRLGATAIRTRAPGYVLDGTATDVGRAEELIAEGRRAAAAGDHEAAIAGFDEALALWRGPALVEFADRQFARAEAARLDELRGAVAEDRIAAMLARGRHHEAVAACETLVDARPLRERRWAQLMVALYRDGRQAEALAACRRLRAVLQGQQISGLAKGDFNSDARPEGGRFIFEFDRVLAGRDQNSPEQVVGCNHRCCGAVDVDAPARIVRIVKDQHRLSQGLRFDLHVLRRVVHD